MFKELKDRTENFGKDLLMRTKWKFLLKNTISEIRSQWMATKKLSNVLPYVENNWGKMYKEKYLALISL